MARPMGDSERKLLEAGKLILESEGFGGLSVRAVAAKAGVNLGLVSYHFGGKHALVRRVSQEVYEEFYVDLTDEVGVEADPLKALRRGLIRLARFVRDRRQFLRSLMRGAMAGDKESQRFLVANVPRHGMLITGLVKRCMKAGLLTEMNVHSAMPFMMGAIATPCLMADGMMSVASKLPFKISAKHLKTELLSDAALEKRVDLVLKALKP